MEKKTPENRIIRTKRRNNFTILNNEIFGESKDKTLKAIGLLCFLISLPDDWEINKQHLYSTFKDGRGIIDSAMKELERLGYIDAVRRRGKGGKFDGIDYFVYDEPQAELLQVVKSDLKPQAENAQVVKNESEPLVRKPRAVEPLAVEPHAVNPQPVIIQYNKELTDKQELSSFSNKLENKEPKTDFDQKFSETTDSADSMAYAMEGLINPPVAPAPPTKTAYMQLMDIYYNWYKERNNGIPPKIDGQEGKALKTIVKYLETTARTKAKNFNITLNPEELKHEVSRSFLFIFANWERIEPFYQTQVKLSQINSNLTNIINGFTNARTNRSTIEQKNDRKGFITDAFSDIDRYYSGE